MIPHDYKNINTTPRAPKQDMWDMLAVKLVGFGLTLTFFYILLVIALAY